MATQALKTALHVPTTVPATGDAVLVQRVTSSGIPETDYGAAGGGGGGVSTLPAATDEGQVLMSGVAPRFAPGWSDAIDQGRY
jgi:hypothetical protein